jgi:hypothetical protein
MHNQLGLSIELNHWLSALGYSSMLGENIHPRNPADLLFPAVANNLVANAAGSLFGEDAIFALQRPGAIASDLWGNVLLPWFRAFAAANHLEFSPVAQQLGVIDKTGEIAAALSLFDGGPLPMVIGGNAQSQIEEAIYKDIGISTMSNTSGPGRYIDMANMTFWDKLVGDLATSYLFSVIPYPNKAKVVPFIPGLRAFWDPTASNCTILARDIVGIERADILPRPIRAVGITTSFGSPTGSFAEGQPASTLLGGIYDSGVPGMVIIKPPPSWLAQCPLSAFTGITLGIGGKGRANAFADPGVGDDPAVAKPRAHKPAKFVQDSKPILDYLAHALYATEILKNRTASIICPLRFDICPGTTIRFETPSGILFNGSDIGGLFYYATVIEVSYTIDAANQQGLTIYRLAHIRNEGENQSNSTSVAGHPLYSTIWPGDFFTERLN